MEGCNTTHTGNTQEYRFLLKTKFILYIIDTINIYYNYIRYYKKRMEREGLIPQ